MKKPYYHAPIRKTHPTLFRFILMLAIVNLLTALALVFGNPQQLINFNQFPDEGIFPPLWFYSLLWTIAAFWLMWGLSGNGSYKWTRRGLTLSSMVGGFWAFGFTSAYFLGTIYGISAPILWSMYTAVCIILTNEPVINPLSAAIQNNFTEGKNPATTPAETRRTRKIRDHDV